MSYNFHGPIREILDALGIKHKIPKEMSFGYTQIGRWTCCLYPSESKGRHSPHRLMIVCHECRREIPAGRWNQHKVVHIQD